MESRHRIGIDEPPASTSTRERSVRTAIIGE